jgi:hypothetical protein
MYNRDNREIRNTEVNRETYQDAQGNTHTRVTRDADTVHPPRATVDDPAYRDGYVTGQVTERDREENQIVRDNDNAARGLLLGVIATSVLGLIIGTLFFLNQREESPAPIAPIIVPNRSVAPAASPSPSPTTKTETRIIERDRVVPVPAPQAPAPQAPAPQAPAPAAPTVNIAPAPAPNVNVTVPNNPAPAPTQPQTRNDATSTQDTTGTTTDTAPASSNFNTGNQSGDTPATSGTDTTGTGTTGTGTTSP